MKNEKVFFTELAYVLGLIILPLGAAFMEAADFGLSMVVAPAYLLHLKLSQIWPFFSFGMAEYVFQTGLLLLLVMVMRRFRWHFLLSIVTAVLYGIVLDFWIMLIAFMPDGIIAIRIFQFVIGLLLSALGVALFFHTYLPPEVYELFVKTMSSKHNIVIHRFKTGYDCVSCIASIAMSFAFFGLWQFEGVKFGTIICALVNGPIIGVINRFMDNRWQFKDRLYLRKYFI